MGWTRCRDFCIYVGASIWLLLSASLLPAQKSLFHRFSIEEGLPSSHVYCVEIDSSGYIWAGTESGVVRYDGYKFDLYNQSNGLPQNEVFNILDDGNGKVWLRSLNFLSYVNNKQVVQSKGMPPGGDRRVRSLGVINDTLFVTFVTYANDLLWFHHEGQWGYRFLPVHSEKCDLLAGHILNFKNKLWGLHRTGLFTLSGPFQLHKPEDGSRDFYNYLFTSKNLGLIFSGPDKLHSFDGDRFQNLYPLSENGDTLSRFLEGFADSRGGIWLAHSVLGVYRYSADDLLSGRYPRENYLRGEEVNWIAEDREGNMWFSTSRGGLIMKPVSSFLIEYMDEEDGLGGRSVEDLLVVSEEEVLLAHENFRITRMRGDSVTSVVPIGEVCRTCRIRGLSLLWDGRILSSSDVGYHVSEGEDRFEVWHLSATKFSGVVDSTLWLGDASGVYVLSPEDFESYKEGDMIGDKVFSKRAYNFLYDKEGGKVWIGTNQGLWTVDWETREEQMHPDPRLGASILDIQKDKEGRIWVATDGRGVFILEGDKVTHLNDKNGLGSNICRRIFHDGVGGIWLATQKGINYLRADSWVSDGRVWTVDSRDGLPSNEVQAFAKMGDHLLVGTSRGLVKMPLDYFERLRLPPLSVEMESVRIMGRDTLLQEMYELPHWQNELNLSFSALSLLSRGDLNFRYRMQGLGRGDWMLTQDRELQYRSLPPGAYQFEVQVRGRDAQWSESARLSILIYPPFSQTFWFWLLFIGGGAVLVGIVVAWRLHQVRQRAQRRIEFQQQITELKLQALRSQMNPHFIFNCLGAIQHFITTSDDRAAHKYLTTFSRLIRKVLENSRVSYINLQDEIETLNLYLKLEHLRFRDRFEYKIDMDSNLNPRNLKVPPMLVQPFIENAVRHGLRHKKGQGNLRVNFTRKDNYVMCTVEDDGIGREASALMRQPTEQSLPSRGVSISEERLASLSQLIQQTAEIVIEDLKSDQGEALGTKVSIFLPIQLTEPSHAEIHHN